MFKALQRLFDSASDGFIKRILAGAGLSLVASAVILTALNFIFGHIISGIGALGAASGLIGLSGLDHAISVVMGAMIFSATVGSKKISLGKAS